MESLRLGAELSVPGLRIVRLVRQDVSGSIVESQPDVWSFVDFEADEDLADRLAAALASVLRPEDGWYADFTAADDHVVVFANRVFRYRRGDEAARDEAVAHGRSAGTPENQLDWGD
jgi:hypothetical protein